MSDLAPVAATLEYAIFDPSGAHSNPPTSTLPEESTTSGEVPSACAVHRLKSTVGETEIHAIPAPSGDQCALSISSVELVILVGPEPSALATWSSGPVPPWSEMK